MSLEEVLALKKIPAQPSSLPNVNYVEDSIKRIFDRWPDVNPEGREEEHEKILKQLHGYITKNEWIDVKMSFVVLGFDVAFLPKYTNRSDVQDITDFALRELKATSRPSIVNVFMRIYSSTFSSNSQHTKELGAVLSSKMDLIGHRWRKILSSFPDYLTPEKILESIAGFMISSTNVWNDLRYAGINDPFSSGIMEAAHEVYVAKLAPKLHGKKAIEELFEWLIPSPGKQKMTGKKIVIEALLDHWLHDTPPEDLRQYITENLISLYDDPRIRPERWNSVEQKYKDVFFSWLTKEDLRFFTSVVDSTQKDPMWIKRRNFWLKLYDEGLIEQAWVAFCPSAVRYARQNLSSSRVGLSDSRFARQTGRSDTSILILKIGTKIFVDGCHNYSTHVWNASDLAAPRLFKSQYDCDEDLRKKSPVGRGKSHSSIPSWSAWVREKIYSTIPYSNKKPVNWESPKRNFSNNKTSLSISTNKNSEFESSDLNSFVPDNFDTNFDDLKSEIKVLRAHLISENAMNFRLKIVFDRIAEDKSLQTVEREALRKIFESDEVRSDDFPTAYSFAQPIFLFKDGTPNFDLWLHKVDKIESAVRKYRLKLSNKATNALAKMRRFETTLDKGEPNSVEHLLQSLRAIGASIDDLLK